MHTESADICWLIQEWRYLSWYLTPVKLIILNILSKTHNYGLILCKNEF